MGALTGGVQQPKDLCALGTWLEAPSSACSYCCATHLLNSFFLKLEPAAENLRQRNFIKLDFGFLKLTYLFSINRWYVISTQTARLACYIQM